MLLCLQSINGLYLFYEWHNPFRLKEQSWINLLSTGEKFLSGTVTIGGAKMLLSVNAGQQFWRTVLLIFPHAGLRDVAKMSRLLETMGIQVRRLSKQWPSIQRRSTVTKRPYELMKKMRASIYVWVRWCKIRSSEVSLPGMCMGAGVR